MERTLTRRASTLALVVALVAPASRAVADGWHNAALATSSLEEWLADVKAVVPDIDQKLNQNELRAGRDINALKEKVAANKKSGGQKAPLGGGKLQNNLTPQQQELLGRKASDCIEALAFMDPNNIFPQEFPNFQLQKIPEYRKTAKQLLRLMGPTGTSAVATELRAELMGMGRVQNAFDVTPTENYFAEMLALLKEGGLQGDLSDEDIKSLREAAAGQKTPALSGLARQVEQALDEIEGGGGNLVTVHDRAMNTTDGKRKQKLLAKLRSRLPEASMEALLELAAIKPEKTVRQALNTEFNKRIANASVSDLLRLMDSEIESAVTENAADEVGTRRPKYSEVKADLAAIATLASSKKEEVAAAAERQLANAFVRAPISDCLQWLSKDDEKLKVLIWKQVDDRIGRADPERRTSYRESAFAYLGQKSATAGGRTAALDLIERLNDRVAVAALIDLLPQLPRESWPKVGKVLGKLTGQDFGPKAGAGVAELGVSLKKWRAWLKDNKSP